MVIKMEILFENKDLVVAVKPAGVLSEESGNKRSMPLLLRADAEDRGIKDQKFYSVHRLDREVGGVMVYAKTSACAAILSKAIEERRIKKEYLAVVKGSIEEEGVLEDLLFRDRNTMKTYVVERKRAGVRDAKLAYKRAAEAEYKGEKVSLVRIKLYTGRTHQIRVQFAHRRHPLVGDGRYGSGDGKDCPALFSTRLALDGYFDCSALPHGEIFTVFSPEAIQKPFDDPCIN